MKISLDILRNHRGFWVQKREHSDLGVVFLVNPSKRKQKWKKGELHLRSLLCREDGEIICSGLPKFFDVAEQYEDEDNLYSTLSAELQDPESTIYLPEKVDGTLLIRTVIEGVVCFRTRGNHELGSFFDPVQRLIKEKYLELLNPNIDIADLGLPQGQASLLMEFVDCNHPIIVRYSNSMLKGIGVMKLSNTDIPYFFSSPDFIEQLHVRFGLDKLIFKESLNDIPLIQNQIDELKNEEGVVVWIGKKDTSFSLLKVKTKEYQLLHKRKALFFDSRKAFFQLCWYYKIISQAHLKEVLEKNSIPSIDAQKLSFQLEEYISVRTKSDKLSKEVENYIAVRSLQNTPRSQLATKAKELEEIFSPSIPMFPLLMKILLGKETKREKEQYFLSVLFAKRINLSSFEENVRLLVQKLKY